MSTQTTIPRLRRGAEVDPLSAELRRRLETEDPRYPHSDGKPLAESEGHMQCIRWLLDALEDIVKGRQNVSLHGDMFWYWQEGHPEKKRAPDAMVIFGVPMDPIRLSYKSWLHNGIAPAVIFETASAEQEDMLLTELRADYERQGVREYFVFDWSGRYLPRRLYGFRLRGGKYQSIRPAADGCLFSKQLNLKMRPEDRMLRFINVETNEAVKTRSEQVADQVAETRRLREILQKAGIDPDAAK
jgi:Uma2 family endonuclease